MATYTKTGTTGNDFADLFTISGLSSLPVNGNTYVFDGLSGTDTLTLSVNNSYPYLGYFLSTNFTIPAVPDAFGQYVISGTIMSDIMVTLKLTSVEQLVFADKRVSLAYRGSIDATPPTVITFNPPGIQTYSIKVTFSEEIQRGTGYIALRGDDGYGTNYNVATSPNLTISGSTITITPTTALEANKEYSVTFGSGSIQDMAGNGCSNDTEYHFNTNSGSNTLPSPNPQIGFGKVATDFGGGYEFAISVTTQPDGKILVAGSSINAGDMDVVLVRYNADGSLDTSFGGGEGKITTDFGYGDLGGWVPQLSDGKVLVIGQSVINWGSDGKGILARYNDDGTLDTSFDGDGKVITMLDGMRGLYFGSGIVQKDGKIVVVGTVYTEGYDNNYFIVLRYNSDGSLDTSFDSDGFATTPIHGYDANSDDRAQRVVQQSDGKLLVAGTSYNGVDNDIVLIRYNTDGSIDNVVITDLKGNEQLERGDTGGGVVELSDGRILVVGQSDGNILLLRYSSDFSFDTSFSGDGKVILDLGDNVKPGGLAVLPDGKILVSGSQNADVLLLRFNEDGTLDATFAGNGKVTANIGGDFFVDGVVLSGANLQADGKILVAGQSNGDIGVIRFNADGTLDTTFGLSANTAPVFSDSHAGRVVTDAGRDEIGRSVIVQPDGKFLVTGLGNGASGFLTAGTNVTYLIGDFALSRYNSDGSLDTTFNGDGVATTYFGGNSDYAMSAALQHDGKVLVAGAGFNRNNGTNDVVLARYNSNGSLDTTFSSNGKVMIDFSNASDIANSVTLQADGKILVAGTAGAGVVNGVTTTNDFALARFNVDGTLDTTFDGDGKLTTDFSGSESAMSVAVQSDGKILAAGSSILPGGNTDFALARFNADGSFDTSFHGDGKLVTDFGGTDSAQSVVVQNDGKILVAGSSIPIILEGGTMLNSNFALARYNTDGTLDTSFHGDGRLTTDFGATAAYARSIILQSDGKILVAGNSTKTGGNSDFALARYNSDGSLDPSFHGDGRFTMDFGGAADTAYSVSVLADGKILVGGTSVIDGNGDFAIARLNPDGTLDTTFGAPAAHQTLYTATGIPVLLDNSIQISDAELATIGNYAGATVTLMRHGGANADDQFSAMVGQFLGSLMQGSDLVERGITVGSVTTNSGGTLALTFNANATPTLVNAVVQQIAYSNGSGTPPSSLQIDWSFSDGNSGSQGSGGALSTTTSTTIQIAPFDAPPVPVTNTAPTFAGYATGKVTTDFGKEDIGRSIAVQSDGKILMGGLGNGISGFLTSGSTTISYTIGDHALARYNADGSLDTTFGVDGKVTAYFGGNGAPATGVTVLGDGKILVAGSGYDRGGSNTNDFSLARYNSDGSLDTTFAGNGKVLTNFSSNNDSGQGIAVQADGRILVVGTSSTVNGVSPYNSDVALARYNADGSLDTTFGGSGKIATDFGGTDNGMSVAVRSDGKIIVVGSSSVVVNGISSIDFASARFNTDGSLESKGTIDFGGNDIARSVAIQSDGKIILVGESTISGNTDFAIFRTDTAGNELDTTFGSNGKIITDFGGNDFARSVVVQSGGKILVAGNSTLAGGVSDFVLARYNTDGTLDTSFDSDGKLTLDFGGASDTAFSIKLQADGKILVAGSSSIDGNGDFALARLNENGSLDTNFGVVNTLNGHPVYIENGTSVVLDSDVRVSDTELVALGNFNGATLTLARHGGASADDHFSALGSGTLGALTQGSNLVAGGVTVGTVTTNSGGTLAVLFNTSATPDLVNAVLQQIAYSNTSHVAADAVQIDWTFSDGNIGSQGTGGALSAVGSTTVHITALNDTPVLGINTAPTFAVGDGIVITDFGKEDMGRSVAVQADGKILVAGFGNGFAGYLTGNITYNIGDFGLTRYNSDGSLDTTFGTDGKLTTYFGGNNDFATAVTVPSDGKILVAGTGYNRVGGSNDFALARYNSDGTLDTTFSANGKVMTDFASTNDTVIGIKVQADGKILVVGTSGTVNGVTPFNSDVALVRYNADGSLDNTFDGDGKLTTDFGGNDSGASAVVLGDGTIFVVGRTSLVVNGATTYDFAFAGYSPNGTLLGKNTLDFGGNDTASSVFVQGDGKILIAGNSSTVVNGVTTGDFALACLNSDGSLDTSFGTGGKLTTDFGSSENVRNIIQQSDGKILLAGTTVIASIPAIALARYNSNGTLDTSFDGDGKRVINFGVPFDSNGATFLSDGKILVTGATSSDGNGDFITARLNTDGSLDKTFGIANTLNGTPVYVEKGAPVVLDRSVQVSDSELAALGNYSGATLTLMRHGGASVEDHFSNIGTLGVLTAGGDLMVDGVIIGTISTNSGGIFAVACNANATQNLVNSALQQIAYSNSTPATDASVQIDWTFSDGNTGLQGTGGALSITGSTTVQLVADMTPPAVTSFSPIDGVLGVTVERDIVLTFSEAIQTGTGNIVISNGTDTRTIAVTDSSQIFISGDTVTINPTGDLHSGSHYHVQMDSGVIKDLAGNNYAGTASYDFTTSDGRIITDFGGITYGLFGMAIQSDGKILMTGTSNGDLALARYNQNGTLDSTFDIDGKVITDFGGIYGGFGVSVQYDGKFFAVGGSDTRVVLAGYNGNGSLNTSFGTGGKVTTDLVGAAHAPASIALQSDGKILVAGEINGDFALARYTVDGTLDTTFAGDGEVTADFGHDDGSSCVVVQSDGKILVAGSSWIGHYADFALVRYNSNGTPDAGFGTEGKVITEIFGGTDQGHGMAIQSDGKILIVGMANGGFAVARYNVDGTLDTTFSGDGKVTTDLGGGLGFGVTVQSDGKILVAGYANQDGPFAIGDNSNCDFGLVRYNTDGTLDSFFGAGGKVVTDFGGTEFATSVVLQSDGKIVLSGYSNNGFALARYNSDGTLDASFIGGSSGADTAAPTVITFSPADAAMGVPVDSDITLTFSEDIQFGSGSIDIHRDSVTGTMVNANLTIVGNTLAINPITDLTSATHYFVTFTDGSIKDLAGNSYSCTDTYDFTTASTSSVHDISGAVTFWKTGAAIADVTSTFASDTMTTGSDGLYHHLDMPDGTYAVTSAKVTGTSESNAVKANDALAALKIAVGMNPNADGTPVSPYQFLAADVNKDGQVKAADALNILKMAVKLTTAPEKEWLFVPESVGSETMSRTNVVWPDNPIPLTLNADQELDLIGIVKGDVNGSWVA
jgi:uncharacterized delta-60 repeat protein